MDYSAKDVGDIQIEAGSLDDEYTKPPLVGVGTELLLSMELPTYQMSMIRKIYSGSWRKMLTTRENFAPTCKTLLTLGIESTLPLVWKIE